MASRCVRDSASVFNPEIPPNPLQSASADTLANVQIARLIVARIVHHKATMPFGASWQRFAEAEILVHLNAASRRVPR
jgi:hypothetical protein